MPVSLNSQKSVQRLSFEEPDEVLKGNHHFEIGVLHGLSGLHMNPILGKSKLRKGLEIECFIHCDLTS